LGSRSSLALSAVAAAELVVRRGPRSEDFTTLVAELRRLVIDGPATPAANLDHVPLTLWIRRTLLTGFDKAIGDPWEDNTLVGNLFRREGRPSKPPVGVLMAERRANGHRLGR